MSNFLNLVVLIVMLSFASKAYGLKCWSCSKTISNDECNARGKFKVCDTGESCLNSIVSKNDGSAYEISKGCRAKKCPMDQNAQNVGTYPMKCKYNNDESVCQCCCATDSCNWPHMECKDVVTCRRPDPPGNGMLKCPKHIAFGSKCIIKCNKGYKRDGPRKIVCSNETSEGRWTPQQPVACLHSYESMEKGEEEGKELVCNPKMKNPKNGNVICTNRPGNKGQRGSNFIGSSCAFKCDRGYFLRGQENVYCLPGGQWSTKAPECHKGTCQAPVQDKHRKQDCSDEYNFDSTCVMSCRKGYKLVGEAESTCQALNDDIQQGSWSNEFPKCVKAECRPQLTSPSNGKMECTNENLINSICTFYCDDNYDLVDTIVNSVIVECVEGVDGLAWSRDPLKCERIMCERLEMPENGIVTCAGDGGIGSKCTFSCNAGYDLVGLKNATQTTECTNDGDGDNIGTWSVQSVTCAPIKCLPERVAPENGKVYCTNENNEGSICTFSCDNQYDMDDTAGRLLINVCEADKSGDGAGKWSASPGTCSTRFACALPMVDPAHGTVSCSDEYYLGSVCNFACEEGYELKGLSEVACRDLKNDGDSTVEWNNDAPTCAVSTCPAQWYDTLSLKVTCSSEKERGAYPVGTSCQYECLKPGHYLVYSNANGKAKNGIKCTKKNKWSHPSAPRCMARTCPVLAKIDNGDQPKCTAGNNFGSVCTFSCGAKYQLTHTDSLTCDGDGEDDKTSTWDKTPPSCTLSECLAVPGSPSKGSVECSSGAAVGSYCTLTCDRGYAPKVNRVDCVLTSETVDEIEVEIPKFQLLNDFCCAECRSAFRFVQMVDARYSSYLRKAIDFSKIFVTQLGGLENDATISTFMYNEDVDETSVIKDTSAKNSEKVASLFTQMQEWSIEEEGLTSDATSALKYANDVMFASLDSDVANFLLVIADDAPKKVAGAIRKLQSRGIHILVAAGNNFAKLKWERTLEGEGNVMMLDANMLMNRVYDLAFKDGCSKLAEKCV